MAEKLTDPAEEETQEVDETEEVDEETQDDSEAVVETEDDATAEETAAVFQKRFTQFKGETPEEYIKNLEEAYANSSKEGVTLAKALKDARGGIASQIANPDDDDTSESAPTPSTPSTDPAVLYARQQMETQMKGEYDQFVEDHPELETDPALQEKVTRRLAALSETILRDENRLVGMGEGLAMAWSSLGMTSTDTQEATRSAAKNSAAASRTSSATKSDAKPQFSEKQVTVAMEAMGVDRREALKLLTANVK